MCSQVWLVIPRKCCLFFSLLLWTAQGRRAPGTTGPRHQRLAAGHTTGDSSMLLSLGISLPGRIVGGQEVKPHSRPYMAYVSVTSDLGGCNPETFMCGGFLIHPGAVLSAAHCVAGKREGSVFLYLRFLKSYTVMRSSGLG